MINRYHTLKDALLKTSEHQKMHALPQLHVDLQSSMLSSIDSKARNHIDISPSCILRPLELALDISGLDTAPYLEL